jgi:SAM-dependent methyltransferase
MSAFLQKQYEGRARLEQLQGYNYELVRCRQCSLAYQAGVPGGRLVNEIYNLWIPLSERDRLAQERTVYDPSYWAQQVHFFIEHLGLRPVQVKVLDFGMGWAEWASMARAFGCAVYGAELSPERLDHAHRMGIPTLDWQEMTVHRFHFINTEQVFEHLIEPLDILKHLASSLAEDGLLKISVPDARAAVRRISRGATFASLSPETIMPVQPLEHVNCFEYETLVRLAAAARLVPLRPRLRLIYNATSGWLHPMRAARLFVRPLYRHVYPKSTFVYFRHANRLREPGQWPLGARDRNGRAILFAHTSRID